MNKISNLLNEIHSEVVSANMAHQKASERNIELFKVLAVVKNDLEKTLKKPETLNETVYRCIDLLRQHTPYFSATEGITKIDPPLTEEQKTL